MTTSFNQAAAFNPAKSLFLPKAGLDYSAFLNSSQPLFIPGMAASPYMNPMMAGGAIGSALLGASPMGAGFGGYYNPIRGKAEMLTIGRSITNLDKAIENAETDKIANAFNALKHNYKQSLEYKMLTRGQQVDDKMLNEIVADKFRSATGKTIDGQLEENVRGNFFSGLWSGMTFGIGTFKSSDDVKEEMFGEEKPTSASVTKGIGAIAGGAATGAAIGSVIPGVGTAIGAGIGAAVGLISRLWS